MDRAELITVFAVLVVGVIVLRKKGVLSPMQHTDIGQPHSDVDVSRHKHDGSQPIGGMDGNKTIGADEQVVEMQETFWKHRNNFLGEYYIDDKQTTMLLPKGSWFKEHCRVIDEGSRKGDAVCM